MADTVSEVTTRPNTIGSNIELIRELLKDPVYGIMFLVILVAEAALFYWLLISETAAERIIAGGLMIALIVVVLVVYTIERGRFYRLEHLKQSSPAAPESMVRDPVQEEVASKSQDVVIAPDGTFLYTQPPKGWTVSVSNLKDMVTEALDKQKLGSLVPDIMPYRTGGVVTFTSNDKAEIEYTPGKSSLNERPVIAVLDETYADQVNMFSVSRYGSMIHDISAEHMFVNLMAGYATGGATIDEIADTPQGEGVRRSLSGKCSLIFNNAKINGAEVEKAVLEARLSVVVHKNFIYVIRTAHLTGLPDSDERNTEIERIVASFQAASSANTADREEKDRKKGDVEYDLIFKDLLPNAILQKASRKRVLDSFVELA
ncbi:hypothetical protein [Parasphingopyxis sp.]|uniref:hypothetical protein n=1 Tax=Parasphingopyxis sp. TaxID=1920299 RepID=UPI00260530A7|nr:hypothetical protein [Parasphingopyxis sp.]